MRLAQIILLAVLLALDAYSENVECQFISTLNKLPVFTDLKDPRRIVEAARLVRLELVSWLRAEKADIEDLQRQIESLPSTSEERSTLMKKKKETGTEVSENIKILIEMRLDPGLNSLRGLSGPGRPEEIKKLGASWESTIFIHTKTSLQKFDERFDPYFLGQAIGWLESAGP